MNKFDIGNLTWKEAEKALSSARLVILPLGSCEQHGFHLPLNTDIVLAEEIATRVAAKVGGLVLPVIPYGQVWSAKDFPGTISLTPETLKAIIRDICTSLYHHGVMNVVLISGHLGNLNYMKEAARELKDSGIPLNVWYFCYPRYKELSKGIMETPLWNDSIFHAGEIETSLMLAVKPEACRMDEAIEEEPPVAIDLDFRPIPWKEFNKSGVFGDAKSATVSKGKAFMERMVDYISHVIDQGIKNLDKTT